MIEARYAGLRVPKRDATAHRVPVKEQDRNVEIEFGSAKSERTGEIDRFPRDHDDVYSRSAFWSLSTVNPRTG